MNKLAIIDSDSLCYQSERESCIESIQVLDEKIQNIFDKTGCTHYILFLSNGRYFRHALDPNYKIKREKYRDKVKWVKVLRQYLIAKWNAQWMEGVEADDLCAYWMNKDLFISGTNELYFKQEIDKCLYPFEKILCSPDKDLLYSIYGIHFNYSYKLENKDDPNSVIKGYWVENSKILTNCEVFKAKQLLMGDAADGVGCLDKVGPVGADKILSQAQGNMNALIPIVFNEYISRMGISKGTYEFQKNYRLLHLLETDEDFIREVGVLPSFPVITEIKKEEIINTEF